MRGYRALGSHDGKGWDALMRFISWIMNCADATAVSQWTCNPSDRDLQETLETMES